MATPGALASTPHVGATPRASTPHVGASASRCTHACLASVAGGVAGPVEGAPCGVWHAERAVERRRNTFARSLCGALTTSPCHTVGTRLHNSTTTMFPPSTCLCAPRLHTCTRSLRAAEPLRPAGRWRGAGIPLAAQTAAPAFPAAVPRRGSRPLPARPSFRVFHGHPQSVRQGGEGGGWVVASRWVVIGHAPFAHQLDSSSAHPSQAGLAPPSTRTRTRTRARTRAAKNERRDLMGHKNGGCPQQQRSVRSKRTVPSKQ
jgi:hypothetical protein